MRRPINPLSAGSSGRVVLENDFVKCLVEALFMSEQVEPLVEQARKLGFNKYLWYHRSCRDRSWLWKVLLEFVIVFNVNRCCLGLLVTEDDLEDK